MTCIQTLELVEQIAAADIEVVPDVRAHFESCPTCASALATARRIEAALAARPAFEAPDGFTSSVLQRIRRERWAAEQHVDRLFNLAMAVAIILVVGGGLALMNVGGVLAATAGLWEFLSTTGTEAARDAAPAFHTYVAAAGLLLSALVMWWWAERTLGL
jgi:anti-sigma factor RsiW